jgi:hypothetical protein
MGATKAEIDRAATMTARSWIDEQIAAPRSLSHV